MVNIMSEKGIVAYVLLVTELGRESTISKEVKKFHGVTDCHVVYGEYDVIVRIEVGDMKVLDEVVSSIRRIPGIIRTTTLIGSP